jgi:RNA polymerase sigma factor FliA
MESTTAPLTAVDSHCGKANQRVARRKLRNCESNRRTHHASRTDRETQTLIHERMADVKYIARRIHDRLPDHIPFEDLVHDGIIGLIDATQKYDHEKDVSFRTYAKFRIRGAILDSMRRLDWGTRSVRRQYRNLEQARQKLGHSLGRYPTDQELAGELSMSLDELYELLMKVDSLRVSSLSEKESLDQRKGPVKEVCTGPENTPLTSLLRSENRSLVMEGLRELPARDRKVLSLYYFEELSLKEIAQTMGVGEARVSQIRSRAVEKLREIIVELTSAPSPCAGRKDEVKQTHGVSL